MHGVTILDLGLKYKKSYGFCTVCQQVFYTAIWKKVLFRSIHGMFEQGEPDNILVLKTDKCISLEIKHVLPLQLCPKISD